MFRIINGRFIRFQSMFFDYPNSAIFINFFVNNFNIKKLSGSPMDGMSSLFLTSVGSESIGVDVTKTTTASNKQHKNCKIEM